MSTSREEYVDAAPSLPSHRQIASNAALVYLLPRLWPAELAKKHSSARVSQYPAEDRPLLAATKAATYWPSRPGRGRSRPVMVHIGQTDKWDWG